ncbi:MAG: hypothetical protein IKP32_03010 [Clostridia bacterium]|nr:hypothetical protein [Clostridia bacterium]
MKKTICLISLLMVLVLVLTACGGGGGGSIEGTWKLTGGGGDGIGNDFTQALQMINSMGGSVTMTFNNGKLTMNMNLLGQTQQEETTYKINGNKLEVEGSTLDFSINGNTLTLTGEGASMTFTRQ